MASLPPTRSSRSISIAMWRGTDLRRASWTGTERRSRTASTTPRTSTARWFLDERTKLVARKVTEFLKESGDRFQKAIVFCVDQEHAARVRQALINENSDLVETNHRYVMRITGADTEGQGQLGNFIDPESRYPVLVTTSRLAFDRSRCRRPAGSSCSIERWAP